MARSRTEPNPIYRSRPWLAAPSVAKPTAHRHRNAIRLAWANVPLNMVFFLATWAGPQRIFAPICLLFAGNGVRQALALRRDPHSFQEKDAKLRQLVAEYQASVAAGTYAGPPARPLWYLAAPLVGSQVLLNAMFMAHTPFLETAAVSIVVTVAILAGGAYLDGLHRPELT